MSVYGQLDRDPLVRYYDVAFTQGAVLDLRWYVNHALASGGPVLDLACGTGRISLELAREGLEVTAIDQSEGMLACFRTKLAQVPPAVADRIDMQRMSMSQFALSRRFRTILCCDAFEHNLTVEDQRACLSGVRDHLLPGGVFLFNIHNPNPRFLSWASSEEAAAWRKRGEYTLPGTSDTLLVEETTTVDLDMQVVSTRLRFSRRSADGTVMEQAASGWQTRYLHRYEAMHLLELCGLRVRSLVGTYEEGPVTPESQLLFTVGLPPSRPC